MKAEPRKLNKILGGIKLALLLGALAILGWSAFPGTAEADFEQQVTCEGSGHTCHAIVGGNTYHLEKQPEAY